MTYRGAMPPGQVYDGHGLNQQQQQQQQQPSRPQPAYPQHQNANRPPNGHNVHTQHQPVQYINPAYTQQPAPYHTTAAPNFSNYNGAFEPPPQLTAEPPLQFVNPSFLQQAPLPPRPPSHVAPPFQPATAIIPPISRTSQLPQQTSSPKNSPRLDENRLPQGTSAKISKDPRRSGSGSATAKSPVLSQASSHIETLPLLVCIAEECLAKANSVSQYVARSMSTADITEHHKLVATGLGCLEIAMKSNKLWPRLEARLCLRYASVLMEETNNIMEAETALTRGIAVCEKHRFVDLKYSSQFLLIKTLFQRQPKAAFKSIDGHIADCTTYKHVPWIYAYRFLRAAFHLQSGTAADHYALDNLRKIAAIATQRDDRAIYVLATLLEGLAHLSSRKDDWTVRVQTCIAQASKLQLDDSVHLPQLDVLLLLLDLACSLHEKAHQISAQKLNVVQKRLKELKHSSDWPASSREVLLPIRRMPNAPQTISDDTRAILRPGDGAHDYLVLSTLSKQDAFALAFFFNGIVALYKSTELGTSSNLWQEAIRLLEGEKLLEDDKVLGDTKPISPPPSLPEALKRADWARELASYTHILVGLQAATLTDWERVKKCLEIVEAAEPSEGSLKTMTLYLKGVFCQGTARLDDALAVWKDEAFRIDARGAAKNNGSHVQSDLAILATLNRLWIMQETNYKNDIEATELLELLRPLCEDSPDLEIRTAYNLVLASIMVNPPLTINQVKKHIQQALTGASASSNPHCLSIAFNIMRSRLFENVVGEQALKSAKAAAVQAKKSGNVLWMSVADGMLAQSYEMQGAIAEARATRESGLRLAHEALRKTEV
ncbi:cohesin loading factor-domain-containing protein [Podospora didyma]|uniref:Cohesin loading factor-domain-containing protein n=1 Tax=Podospora didyma TaxID=330526 RepID=A0AAE0KKF0_9PEZI|nr:cohesin loading factor-domain-containing protein [Podospora didyma]